MNTEQFTNSVLIRHKYRHQTRGYLVIDGIAFETLELPWADNKRSISCVPDGTYKVFSDWSNNKGRHVIELLDVPNRSQIQIHYAKNISWLKGCIGVVNIEDEARIHTILKGGGFIHIHTI